MISFDEFIKQDDEEKYNNMQYDMFQIQALEDELKNRDIYISKLKVAYSKEIERLNKGYCKFKEECGKYATCLRENQLKENERLNNIINELEKYIKNNKVAIGIKKDSNYAIPVEYVLDKLQELKGDNK